MIKSFPILGVNMWPAMTSAALFFLAVSPLASVGANNRNQEPELKRVKAIEFVGNHALDAGSLRNALRLTQVGGLTDPGKLEVDIEMNLKSFLKQNGFLQCEVDWDELRQGDRDIAIRIRISEGIPISPVEIGLHGCNGISHF